MSNHFIKGLRIIRLILISTVVLGLILAFLFALFPANIAVSRIAKIHSTPENAVSYIANLQNWPKWNYFASDSLLTHVSISRPSSGIGALLQSDQLSVRITEAAADSVCTAWTDKNGRSFKAVFHIIPADADFVYVQWEFRFHLPWYPWEKFGAMFYEKQLSPAMDRSLALLGRMVEENP